MICHNFITNYSTKKEDDISVKDLDSFEGKKLQCNPNTFKGIKVCVDRLGNIQPFKTNEEQKENLSVTIIKSTSNLVCVRQNEREWGWSCANTQLRRC